MAAYQFNGHTVEHDEEGYILELGEWSKELADGARAVLLFNRSKREANITFSWSEIGYPEYLSLKVRDLWEEKDLGEFQGSYSATVPSHGVVMLRIK